jgi:pilus assembly protein CpaE
MYPQQPSAFTAGPTMIRGPSLATSRILLISDTGDGAVADALRAAGHETIAAPDLDTAASELAAVGDTVEVVVIDIAGPVRGVIELGRSVRASSTLTGLPILCISQTDDVEDRIALLEAGIDDVIARPYDARELDARTEALALRLKRSRDLSPPPAAGQVIRDRGQQRTIAVFSPKGGVGTTTVAVNVATALAIQLGRGVALIDLDLQFGQVTTHLNMTTRMTVTELARDDAALRDPGLFQAAFDRHSTGLMVLGSPATPPAADSVPESAIVAAVSTAARAFQIVVIDAGSAFDARTEAAITHATDIVIVVTPEFPALKAVHAFGEVLKAQGDSIAETTFVLNEIFARELLRIRDIEEALGTRVAQTIPYDQFAFLKSVNEGVPIVVGTPRAMAADQLRRLAGRLTGIEVTATPGDRKSKGLAGLFGR